MLRKAVSEVMLTLLLMSILSLAFNIQPVKTWTGTVYIRADGSIDPPDAPITTPDNVTYTLTDNITSSANGIVVERSNIIVDGNEYALIGSGFDAGIELSFVKNVTIRELEIISFSDGVILWNSSNNVIRENNIVANSGVGIYGYKSSSNVVIRNNVMGNRRGIQLEGYPNSNNLISENNVESNRMNGIWLGSASNNTIIRNNITANGLPERKEGGMLLYQSLNSSVIENNIQFNYEYGIKMVDSALNTIIENNVTHNVNFGILLEGSQANLISQNKIIDNVHHGILIRYCYGSNTLRHNNLAGNHYNFGVKGYMDRYVHDVDETNTVDGKPIYYWVNRKNCQIPPDAGYVAIVNSTNIKVEGFNLKNNYQGILIAYSNNIIIHQNNVTNNRYGIWLDNSSNNRIYHNNFIDNYQQAYSYSSQNVWDDGYPSGGNYWSNYIGTDFFIGLYQNETGSDGFGDTAYVIDENNVDEYPLMGPFLSFNTSVGHCVDVVSNSTVQDFKYFNSNGTIVLHVSNMTADQAFGFCRLTIPHDVISSPYMVKVNDTTIGYQTVHENYTKGISIIYFTYEHSQLEIIIVPEYPSTIILLMLMLTTLMAAILVKKRKPKP